jgi:putative salt-induced outer membrane protein YdiY
MQRMTAIVFPVLAAAAIAASAQETKPPVTPPVNPWSSSLGAGIAFTSGNSDTKNINVNFNTAYDPKTDRRFKADALYLRGETSGTTNVDKAAADARYERDVQQRAFWFGEVSYLRDPFKDIRYLVAPVAGAGVNLIKTTAKTLTVDGGVGATFDSGQTSGAVKAGQSFDWTISPTSKFTQKLNGLWKTRDFNDALYHFDAGIATTVAARADLKLSYLYDYKNRPPAGVKKGDSALFAALLFKW